MSIQSEIERIQGNVQSTISNIAETGVSVPEGANSDDLPSLAAALANEKQDKLVGTAGQVVGFNESGAAVAQEAPSGLPEGGTEGQVLTKAADGAAWSDLPDGVPIVDATSTDGVNYTATVPGLETLENGQLLVIVPNMNSSTSGTKKLNVNGTGAISVGRKTVGVRWSIKFANMFFAAGNPSLLLYQEGSSISTSYWLDLSRPSTEADDVYFNPVITTGLTSDDVQGALEELAARESGMSQDAADERYLQLSGGTMAGSLNMGGQGITNVQSLGGVEAEPIDVARINLVAGLSSDGGLEIDFGGDRIQGVDTPVDDTDAANKGYVDGLVGDINSVLDSSVKIETGSYVGTGTYGSSNPNSLTFGFQPKIIIINQFKTSTYNYLNGWSFSNPQIIHDGVSLLPKSQINSNYLEHPEIFSKSSVIAFSFNSEFTNNHSGICYGSFENNSFIWCCNDEGPIDYENWAQGNFTNYRYNYIAIG